MKAIILSTNKETWSKTKGYELADLAAPEFDAGKNPNEVLIEPIFAGICGTDKGIWNRKAFGDAIVESLEKDKRDHYIMGHELFGKVIAVGNAVTRVKPGDHVSTESHIFCGECENCVNNKKHVCMNERIIGVTADGVFAEKIVLPERILWPTDPEKVRPEIAAVQEPFGNAVHVCTPIQQLAEDQLKDKTIAILGCGTIGLFAAIIAKSLGARKIVGVEPNAVNAERAKKCGVDVVLQPHDKLAEEIKDNFDGKGPGFCFEMTGIPASINTAIHSARRGGRVALFGLSGGDLTITNFQKMIVDGIHVHSIVGRRIFESWHITKKLIEQKSVQDLIWKNILDEGKGSILPIADFSHEAFEAKTNKHAKALIQINPFGN